MFALEQEIAENFETENASGNDLGMFYNSQGKNKHNTISMVAKVSSRSDKLIFEDRFARFSQFKLERDYKVLTKDKQNTRKY